jgi:hypothetical protein
MWTSTKLHGVRYQETVPYSRRCENQQFSLRALRHVPFLHTLAIVDVVTHGHKIGMNAVATFNGIKIGSMYAV